MVKLYEATEKQIKKSLKLNDSIDLKALWDSKLTKKENITNLCEQLNISLVKHTKAQDKDNQAQAEEYLQQELNRIIEETEQLEKEALKEIRNSSPNIEKHFYIPINYIKNVTQAQEDDGLYSFIWLGNAGLGKTHTTIQELNKIGEKGKDWEILSGYATPLELYTFLYENKDKIVVLDDIPSLFDNPISYHILLSILWNVSKVRTVSYLSSSQKLKVPSKFDFRGKVIFLTNIMPKEAESLKSRCLFYETKFSYADKIAVMQEIAKIREIPNEIIDYVVDNTDETTNNLNFRLLIKIYGLYKMDKTNWKQLADEQLNKDEYMSLVKTLTKTINKVSEQVSKWTDETGMSRRSFFYYKKRMEKDWEQRSAKVQRI